MVSRPGRMNSLAGEFGGGVHRKAMVGEGCGENSKRKGLGWASRGYPCAVWEREIIFPRTCVQVLIA